MLTLLLAASCAAPLQEAHPLKLDRTGIEWQLPFETAVEHSRKRERLLMIKPVAFGTDRKGGW